MSDTIRLWFLIVTDEPTGKRRTTNWRMTEKAAASYPSALKVEGSISAKPGAGSKL